MKKTWMRGIVAAAGIAGVAEAQQNLISVPGGAGAELGAAAVDAGDHDGDGIADVLVGEPGWNNGQGRIVCISGAYLATGTGTKELWTKTGPSLQSRYGTSIAAIGQLVGDPTPDFAVGAPRYSPPASSITTGGVFIVDGAPPHSSFFHVNGYADTTMGETLVCVGDADGDGLPDLATSSGYTTTFGARRVFFVPGSSFLSGPPAIGALPHGEMVGANGFGSALASGFDLDGDGLQDLALSSHLDGSGNSQGAGRLIVVKANTAFTPLGTYSAGAFGEHMGMAIDTADHDRDGIVDFLVGAPDWNEFLGHADGRVIVVSGAALLSNTGPFELDVFDALEFSIIGGARLGAAVRVVDDLNGDGSDDYLFGMPRYSVHTPFEPDRGGALVVSGRTSQRLGIVLGEVNDSLGDFLPDLARDLDGDGFPEFFVAGSRSDVPTADCGTLEAYSLFPTAATSYCTGKLNSAGCVPGMHTSGLASASASAPFLVEAGGFLNKTSGMLLYSHGAYALPLASGFCLQAPRVRTPVQNSGGTVGGVDCSGTYSYDFNARIQSGADATLVVGAEVFCQYWSRDPQDPAGTSLSNATRFVVNP